MKRASHRDTFVPLCSYILSHNYQCPCNGFQHYYSTTVLIMPNSLPDVTNLVCFDWSAHICLSQYRSQCLRLDLLCFQLLVFNFTSAVNINVNYENVWHGDVVMSSGHIIKGGTTDKVFQALCELFNFHVHKNLFNTLKERNVMEKHNRPALIMELQSLVQDCTDINQGLCKSLTYSM